MKRIIIATILCFVFATSAKSQEVKFEFINDFSIDSVEFHAMQERILDKVSDFQHWLQVLAGCGGFSHNIKMEIYDRTLKLFIGEGKSYTALESNPSGGFIKKPHPAVTMSTIHPKYNKKYTTKHPMTTYLTNLIKRSEDSGYRYKQVLIETAEIVRVDNFSKVDDGRYVATAHLLSSFIGYDSDGKQVCHHDYTHKTIMFYFNPLINSFPDETSCVTPILFLGDISSDDVW